MIEIEGNSIRLYLKTYIPYLEVVLRKQNIESIIEPLEMNHELIIETVDGTWEPKNFEVRLCFSFMITLLETIILSNESNIIQPPLG